MPGRLTNTDIQQILNQRFGNTASTPPATYFLGLSTTTPIADGTGVTEPVGGGYARVAVANNTTNWPNISGTSRTKTNGVAFVFNTATANWGTITHFLIYDNATAGTLRAYGPLAAAVAVLSGETRSFPVGSITITAPSN